MKRAAPILSIQCFGAPQIRRDQTPMTPPLGGKALALFLYLAVTGRPHRRDLLADLLWSEMDNQQARNNLRYLLPELRNVLGDYLLITPQTIAFAHDQPYQLDSERFHQTVTLASDALSTADLQAALDLYQGDFLAGIRVRNAPIFEQWVTTQQEAFHTLAMQGLLTLTERYCAGGNYPQGLITGQRLLTLEPWHEAGHRLQMKMLALDGQRSVALTQYQRLHQVLAEELAVEPDATTIALYEAIRRGDYDKVTHDKVTEFVKVTLSSPQLDFVEPVVTLSPCHPVTLSPCHPVISSPLHNLPNQLTPFFGREQEIADLYAQLHQTDYRLITLVGEGGVGKSRLALTVAQAILDSRFWILDLASIDTPSLSLPGQAGKDPKSKIQSPKFPDGVWFVPLHGLTASADLPDQLAIAIAQAMNFLFSGTEALTAQLLTYLRHKHALLILDNFEQLAAYPEFIVELLQKTSGIKLLITSRTILNLQAEYQWAVTGLPTPETDPPLGLPPAELQKYSSIALFVERAQRSQRGFQLDNTNQQAISQICRLLHGLPLGIELAAAQLRSTSHHEIVQRLTTDALSLMTSYRDLPPRHRSLTTVLEDSWRLLTPAEQTICARLSIFHSNFTFAAASKITGATPAILTALCDQSLLHQAGPQRYQLHEFVRQFAAEKLKRTEAEAESAIAAQHGRYYLAFIRAQEDALHGAKPQAVAASIHQELGHIEQAWLWAVAEEQTTLLAQSCWGLHEFYHHAYLLAKGKQTFMAGIAMIRQQLPPAPADAPTLAGALAALLCAYGHLLLAQDAYEESIQTVEQALALVDEVDEQAAPQLVARGAYIWGVSLSERGEYAQAEAQLLRALDLARTTAHFHLATLTLIALARLGEFCANYTVAQTHGQEALALSRTHHDDLAEYRALTVLGSIAQRLGALQQAQTHWEAAVALRTQIGGQANQAMLLNNLGVLYDNQGNYAAAQRAYQTVLQWSRERGLPLQEAETLANLGISADYVGDYVAALRYSQDSLQLWQTFGLTGRTPIVLVNLALHAHHLTDQHLAQTYAQQALAISQEFNNHHLQSYAWTILGHVAAAVGALAEAETAYTAAIALAQTLAIPLMRIEPLAGLVRVALAQIVDQPAVVLSLGAYLNELWTFLTQTQGNGLEEPFRVYLTCYQGLQACGDGRAGALLAQAYALLQQRAQQIDDPTTRDTFLENVAAHRQLCKAAQTTTCYESTVESNPLRGANHHADRAAADGADHRQGAGPFCLPDCQSAATHARSSGGSALE